MLQVRELSKRYKDHVVLKEVSFSLTDGEVLGIVGPNGAGKSTLLRILSGIIDADGGEVVWNGQPLNIRASESWGYLPEERGLYPQMPVLDQLIHFGGLKGLSTAKAKNKALQLLQECDMEQYRFTKAGDLSKGNQQRIQFLSAILHEPSLIILDEPFSGLDPIQTDWLKAQMCLFREKGKKIIYSSHHMDSVEALCDRILVLHKGQRCAYGTSAELCEQPQGIWQVALNGGDETWLRQVQLLHRQQREQGRYEVRFSLNHQTTLPATLSAIEKSGAVLESLRPYKRSLHEVFVQLTKKASDE